MSGKKGKKPDNGKKKTGNNWVKAEDILNLPPKDYQNNVAFLVETKAGIGREDTYLEHP